MITTFSLVVITGLSGAGKSTASKVLEDLGYYAIDNIPLKIIEKFVEVFFDIGISASKIALIIDSRSRDEKTAFKMIHILQSKYNAKVIFLTASTDILVNRFKENRRKHPLGNDILDAIAKEEEMLKDIKSIANIVVDTSELNVHQLTEQMNSFFMEQSSRDMLVSVNSFGFKYGIPLDSDLVFDVRFIRNPYFVEDMREETGQAENVQNYVFNDAVTTEFFDKLTRMIRFLIPHYQKEGKQFLKISIGCTGGRHRSVAIAEKLADFIQHCCDVSVQIKHRDIAR